MRVSSQPGYYWHHLAGETTGGLERRALIGIVRMKSYRRIPTIDIEGLLLALDPDTKHFAISEESLRGNGKDPTERLSSFDSFYEITLKRPR